MLRDIKTRGVENPAPMTMLFPYAQSGRSAYFLPRQMTLLVKTTNRPELLAQPLRHVVREATPGAPVSKVRSMEEAVGTALASRRFSTLLLGWFAALALLLAGLTPSVLGQVILFGNTSPVTDRIVIGGVIGYTLIHLAVFIAMGLFITELVHLAVKSPLFRFGLLMLFVVFQLFFYGFTYVFFVATRELFPWWEVLVADTLAVVVMVTYLWRKHPSLKRALAHEALGA